MREIYKNYKNLALFLLILNFILLTAAHKLINEHINVDYIDLCVLLLFFCTCGPIWDHDQFTLESDIEI